MAEVDVCCSRCHGEYRAPVRARHRLVCGDSSDEVVHQVALEGEAPALVLTDPPYGVGIDYGEETDDTPAAISELMGRVMPLLLRHPVVLVVSGMTLMFEYPKPRWVLTWFQPEGSGRGPWGFTCANLFLAYGPDPYLQRGLGSRPDGCSFPGIHREGADHPVAKPVTVWRWMMERGSVDAGDLVFDPFGGSGTTAIVAEQAARRSAMIELSPRFCDVICRRWAQVYGTSARHAVTGAGFPG